MQNVTTDSPAKDAFAPAMTTDTRGIASGTLILTQDGALPVDFVSPGDKIITREGYRVLRGVTVHRYSGPAIRIASGALGHNRPDQDLTLPAETPVFLRDWRAEALYGQPQAIVPLSRLADGEFIAPDHVLSMRLYELTFDTPQIVYAEGLELACGAAEVAAETDVRYAAE